MERSGRPLGVVNECKCDGNIACSLARLTEWDVYEGLKEMGGDSSEEEGERRWSEMKRSNQRRRVKPTSMPDVRSPMPKLRPMSVTRCAALFVPGWAEPVDAELPPRPVKTVPLEVLLELCAPEVPVADIVELVVVLILVGFCAPQG